jgi:hypothetical protein
MSPAGVETVMVPVMTRDFNFPSAARPPSAARCFSTIWSGVCACASCAQPTTSSASVSLRETALMSVLLMPVTA